jgi:threonine dehydrogenase-like Zn-dependent dehydrogenase
MQQLTQKLKTGSICITEVPLPHPKDGYLLVRNHYSLISAGTEGGTVKTARKGYIGKAKERPEQVKQVVRTFKTQGPVQTYRAVMKKLDSYSPLGYSCAGEVIEVGSDARGFEIGDFVACGGLTASHAEIVNVPVNLCVKLEKDADLKQAAYNTLGAIAMQGVRLADVRLGETCGVIGLGLIGQLTALLLKASAVRVIGIDVNPATVDTAQTHCTDLAFVRTANGTEENISQHTNGLGCDAVIITAASSSLDPINFAGAICRKRGTVVVVGDVPTGFDREPHFYKKELQLKMSCSYGPGRYDPVYEEKGLDYPAAYVRWTENRNMQAFQSLIQAKNIDVAFLTTHTFKLEDAPEAYDMMMAKSDPFIGILIEYDITKETNREKIIINPQPATRNPLLSDLLVRDLMPKVTCCPMFQKITMFRSKGS